MWPVQTCILYHIKLYSNFNKHSNIKSTHANSKTWHWGYAHNGCKQCSKFWLSVCPGQPKHGAGQPKMMFYCPADNQRFTPKSYFFSMLFCSNLTSQINCEIFKRKCSIWLHPIHLLVSDFGSLTDNQKLERTTRNYRLPPGCPLDNPLWIRNSEYPFLGKKYWKNY